MSDNENDLDEFITICNDKNITERKFKKNVIKYCNTIENKSDAIKLVIRKIAHRYSLIKIFFDYMCENFDINKKEIGEKYLINNQLILSLQCKFNLSLYFYDIDTAANVLIGKEYEYYEILEKNPIDEKDHRKMIRKIRFARHYLEDSLCLNNFEEVEKCLKYGYRPCKKTFNEIYGFAHLSADNTIIFIDLLIKYHISPIKIGGAVFREAFSGLSVELLDICIKYGFNITHSGNELSEPTHGDIKHRETNFIQKLINVGVDTFEIVDIIKDRTMYWTGR